MQHCFSHPPTILLSMTIRLLQRHQQLQISCNGILAVFDPMHGSGRNLPQ
ncbi:unnamed protein product [Staurois parvus]|uniref:Uncharacterized protein n=1 Tax=Staurois parvus TaxID=386267 RepID=A0ABN9EZD5_9NEOB|nr:unnamed protein product [Staurois parvus]